MDFNNSGISQPNSVNAGIAGRAGENMNGTGSFSSQYFAAGGGINRSRSLPRDIPDAASAQGQPFRYALSRARQSQDNMQPQSRFMVTDMADGKQVAALLETTIGVRDGIACTPDYRRFLIQHQGAIFNFCLDDNGAIITSAMVHHTSRNQQDFVSVAGQPSVVFQKMEGARRIVEAYQVESAGTFPWNHTLAPCNGGFPFR